MKPYLNTQLVAFDFSLSLIVFAMYFFHCFLMAFVKGLKVDSLRVGDDTFTRSDSFLSLLPLSIYYIAKTLALHTSIFLTNFFYCNSW